MRIFASGLRFPEGPIAMADGSVLVVEIERGTLTRAHPDGELEVIAEIAGAPNGAAIGPDGHIFICNSGGYGWIREGAMLRPGRQSKTYAGGGIDVVDLATGKVERLYDRCGVTHSRAPTTSSSTARAAFGSPTWARCVRATSTSASSTGARRRQRNPRGDRWHDHAQRNRPVA
jgi:hypothetical protein